MVSDSSPCPAQPPKLALRARLSLDSERPLVDLGRRLVVAGLLAHLGKFEDLNVIIGPRYMRYSGEPTSFLPVHASHFCVSNNLTLFTKCAFVRS